MLVKNVYLLYPPGYSGSYVNWCINISDVDRFGSTVKNPINTSKSNEHGGSGTAHLHLRIPTHQSYTQHVNWVLLNKPSTPQIYIINTGGAEKNNFVVSQILQHDPNGIIINIHNNCDSLIDSYGAINSATKWPVMYVAGRVLFGGEPLPHDPFDCSDDILFRNWAVDNKWGQGPLDFEKINQLFQRYLDWYQIRNKYQPHEVNDSHYITNFDSNNRIFEFTCLDIAGPNFLNIFLDLMTRSQCSNNFDLEYVNNFHINYINAQKNLQWFKSVAEWEVTGKLDDYLMSHSIIQARLIALILERSNITWDWNIFYNNVRDSSWPDCDEVNFSTLTNNIQFELTNKFGYAVRNPKLLDNNWHTLSLNEINNIYQMSLTNNV
jgi:hypothetical protein